MNNTACVYMCEREKEGESQSLWCIYIYICRCVYLKKKRERERDWSDISITRWKLHMKTTSEPGVEHQHSSSFRKTGRYFHDWYHFMPGRAVASASWSDQAKRGGLWPSPYARSRAPVVVRSGAPQRSRCRSLRCSRCRSLRRSQALPSSFAPIWEGQNADFFSIFTTEEEKKSLTQKRTVDQITQIEQKKVSLQLILTSFSQPTIIALKTNWTLILDPWSCHRDTRSRARKQWFSWCFGDLSKHREPVTHTHRRLSNKRERELYLWASIWPHKRPSSGTCWNLITSRNMLFEISTYEPQFCPMNDNLVALVGIWLHWGICHLKALLMSFNLALYMTI